MDATDAADAAIARIDALRDRVVAALVEPGALLGRADRDFAHLFLAGGIEVLVVASATGALGDEAEAAIAARSGDRSGGELVVVAVGAASGARRSVGRARRPLRLQRKIDLVEIGPDWRATAAIGRIPTPLRAPLARVASSGPIAPIDLAARVAADRARIGDVGQLKAALDRRTPWVTIALAIACAVLFKLGLAWGGGEGFTLYAMGANAGDAVRGGEPWRVLSSAFLHGGVGHLAANLIALGVFGPLLERLFGARRFVLLYGLSALGGGLASALLRGPGLSVGASGAIWGLMAAGLALAFRPRGLLPPVAMMNARRRALVPLGINVAYSFTPGIDLYAHVGGGLVGFALVFSGLLTAGLVPVWTEASAAAPPASPGRGRFATALAAIVGAALIGSVGLALATGRPWELGGPPSFERVAIGSLSLEVPAIVAADRADEPRGEATIVNFGARGTSPIAVEVVFQPLARALTTDERDGELAVMRREIASLSPPELKRHGEAAIVRIDGRPYVTQGYVREQLQLRAWMTTIRDRFVIVRIYDVGARPRAWIGIDDRIVGSLK